MGRVSALHDDVEVRRGLQLYTDFGDQHLPAIAAIFSRIYASSPAFSSMIAKLTGDALLQQNRASMVRIRKGAYDGDWSDYVDDLEARGVAYANAGMAFTDWAGVFAAAQVEISDLVFRNLPDGSDEKRLTLKGLGVLFDTIVQMVGGTYFEAQSQKINAQATALLDLSTPVLVVDDGLLLVPLIGHIDARRGERLRTTLLEALRAHRARAVVLDLSGVPAVDSHAAAHLIRCVEAARLMGARIVLSGLSADVCNALVALGVDLRAPTFAALHDALDDARGALTSSATRHTER